MDEHAQGEVVHALAFGKGKRLAHEASQALAQRAVPTLHVAGFARTFAGAAMGALGKGFGVGQPEVAAGRPAAIAWRDPLAQSTGTIGE